MNFKPITSECSCFGAQDIRYGDWNVLNFTDILKAINAFRKASEEKIYWVIHLNNRHINNIFIDNISLKRLE